jgi:hypothetical protein
MNFLSKINHIPFKYVAGMNIAILVMGATFLSINTVSQTTENRSRAAETPLPSPILSITLDPRNPPQLLNSDPDWAKIGDALLIRGQNLGAVPFGELFLGEIPIPPQNIVEWAPDHIVVTIPNSAVTAPLLIKFNTDKILQTSHPIRIVEFNQTGL